MKMLAFSGDPEADRLLAEDRLALLIGMVLDQQIPLEWAFKGPLMLKERLGGRLDAAEIAAMDPDELKRAFLDKPALHRFPAAMAARVQELCQHLVERYDGRAERVWSDAETGDELFDNVRALPGFGEQKAKIFTALLGKQLGVTPPGWEEKAGDYGKPGHRSVADITGPDTLAKVRQYKREMKARAKR